MTIAHRLILGFSVVLLLTLGFGLHQLIGLGKMKDFATTTVNKDFTALQLVRLIGNNHREMKQHHERAWVAFLLNKLKIASLDAGTTEKKWQLARDRTQLKIQELETLATNQAKSALTIERKDLWLKIAGNARETSDLLRDISTVVVTNFDKINRDEMSGVQSQLALLDELREKLRSLGQRTEDLTNDLATSAENDIVGLYGETKGVTIVSLAVALVLGILIAVVIYRSITQPLAGFMAFVSAVGRGDLTQRARSVGRDEIGQLGTTLNEMVISLADVSGQTKAATENLNAATAELQASAQQQAASTSEQSAAVQQITSTLEEIAQSGSQISERAKGVAQSAEAASSASKSGLQAVAESSRAIQSIRDQAERVAGTVVTLTEKTQSVGEIIASVNEIAERSNLLALNAAIEAAAAGEAGASFSVVADEIKNLADQAKEATGQVHGLLSEIQQGINSAVMQTEEAVKRADYGAEQSKQTETTITELARSVEQSVATFEQIIAATNQQQIGVEQVSVSVQSIREASEQIAAGISDLEKSSSNLNVMSSQLRQSVERYRL